MPEPTMPATGPGSRSRADLCSASGSSLTTSRLHRWTLSQRNLLIARYAHLACDTVKASAARIGDSIDGDLEAGE